MKTDTERTNEMPKYIHGSSREEEAQRLYKQAEMLEEDLWRNVNLTKYLDEKNKPFLEVGCGVGAQTLHILQRIPQNMNLIGVDIDKDQINKAEEHLSKFDEFHQNRYSFETMDITNTPLEENSLSGAYICWVLEHLKYSQALSLMKELKKAIEPGGVIIINEIIMQPEESVIIKTPESDFPPETKKAFLEIIKEQESRGGNPNIGTKENLEKLLTEAGIINYEYTKLNLRFTEEKVPIAREVLTDLIESIIPGLDDTKINMKEIEVELAGVTEFNYHCGQCVVEC